MNKLAVIVAAVIVVVLHVSPVQAASTGVLDQCTGKPLRITGGGSDVPLRYEPNMEALIVAHAPDGHHVTEFSCQEKGGQYPARICGRENPPWNTWVVISWWNPYGNWGYIPYHCVGPR